MVDENCRDFALAARASVRLRAALMAAPGFWVHLGLSAQASQSRLLAR